MVLPRTSRIANTIADESLVVWLVISYKRWGWKPAPFPMEGVVHTRDKT